jgi:hypothetical protein
MSDLIDQEKTLNSVRTRDRRINKANKPGSKSFSL